LTVQTEKSRSTDQLARRFPNTALYRYAHPHRSSALTTQGSWMYLEEGRQPSRQPSEWR